MSEHSIVVLRRRAAWPAFVDERGGSESNVYVFAERCGETVRELEARVVFELAALRDSGAPSVAVVAAGAIRSPEEQAFCLSVLRELVSTARNGSVATEVVLTAGGDERAERQARALADNATRSGGGVRVHVDFSLRPSVRRAMPMAPRARRVA